MPRERALSSKAIDIKRQLQVTDLELSHLLKLQRLNHLLKLMKAIDIKRQLQITDRELSHQLELQWIYSKRLLKFGFISWILSLAIFLFAIIIVNVHLISQAYGVWAPLLIVGFASPMIVTAVMLRKFSSKVKYLERIQSTLLTEYEKAILKRVEKLVNER